MREAETQAHRTYLCACSLSLCPVLLSLSCLTAILLREALGCLGHHESLFVQKSSFKSNTGLLIHHFVICACYMLLALWKKKKKPTQINPVSHYAFLGTGRKRVSGNTSPNYKDFNDKTIPVANFE